MGDVKPGKTTFTLTRGDSVIVFEGVPATICENCGEVFFDEEVNNILLKTAEDILKNRPKIGVFPYIPNHNGTREHAIV